MGGVVADRYWPMGREWWWLAAVVACGGWAACVKRGWNAVAGGAVLMAWAAMGAAWHHGHWNMVPPNELGFYATEAGVPCVVRALVLEQPRIAPAPARDPLRIIDAGEQSRLDVQVTHLRQGETWEPVLGRVRLEVQGHLLGVYAGDEIQAMALLVAPRPAVCPGQFDRAAHARADRVRAILRADFPECVKLVRRGNSWRPDYWLDRLRVAGDRLLWRHLQHERSGMATALLLGVRDEMDYDRTEAFLHTGTIHILSISGLHVGILAAALFVVFRLGWLPRSSTLWAVGVLVALYVLVTDARAPVVRAGILVEMVCLSLGFFRRLSPFNILAGALIVVLAINPADLFRTGPQLSFLCVAALSALGPWAVRWERRDELERLLDESRGPLERAARWQGRWLWRTTVASAVVWVVTLPVVMTQFHVVPWMAILLNSLLWLPVALALWAGFGVLLFGGWLPWMADAAGWVCDGSIRLLEQIVNVSAALPGSHFWVSGPPGWWMAGYYAALALWLAGGRIWVRLPWMVVGLATWSFVGWGIGHARQVEGQVTCAFLPVGHGAAVVLELPDGQVWLYDAGQLGSPQSASQTISGYLWSRGITRLDGVILSHADVDHYNALPALADKFSISEVYISPTFQRDHGEAVQTLFAALAEASIPLKHLATGDRLPWGPECSAIILHPAPDGVRGRDNANSVVVLLEYSGRRLLLTGDLESPGLEQVLAQPQSPLELLMAPHHGSLYSNPPGLVSWCHPRTVVISCGHGDNAWAVRRAYESQQADVFSTSENGLVSAILTPAGCQVTPWRVAEDP